MNALDRHALGVLPRPGRSTGTADAGAVKRAFGCAAVAAAVRASSRCPCQSVSCAGGSSVMPSHQTSPSSVSATLVKIVLLGAAIAIALGLDFDRSAGRDAEEARLRVDGVEPAVRAGLDPGDVVADGGDLPALEALRAGSAWRSWSCRRRSGTRRRRRSSRPRGSRRPGSACARRASPRRAPCTRRCAARSTSCRAARCRRSREPKRPDRALLGEVDDVLVLRVARPGDVLLARPSGTPTECRHGTNSPSSPSTSSTALAHAGHDPHVDDDVGGVGDLHADLRDGRADRAHAERHDVHRPARACTREQPGEGALHLLRRPSSCWSARRRSWRRCR